MKSNKLIAVLAIAVAIAMAATPPVALAATKVALIPMSPTVSISGNGHAQSVELEAFCNATPCNIAWQQVQSNSNVGTLDKCSTCADTTTGPISHFTAGTTPGWVVVIINDDNQQHVATTTITVVP
jgi:hypothetical protein